MSFGFLYVYALIALVLALKSLMYTFAKVASDYLLPDVLGRSTSGQLNMFRSAHRKYGSTLQSCVYLESPGTDRYVLPEE